MNQSYKKSLEFIKNSGVNYFLQDSPRNWFKSNAKTNQTFNKVDGNKLKEIENIIKKIKDHKSPLQKSAKNLVVYDGNINSEIMFIGEAPGRDEDIEGLPFVGKAGQLLNKMLSAIKLNRDDVYITNVVNWRPPNNRTPTDEEILEFLPFLQQQINVVNPKYIFLLGSVAAKAVLSTPLSLGMLRGKWHEYKSLQLNKIIYVIASYHPAFLLRSPQYKKSSWQDLLMLKERIKNEN